MPSLLPFSAIVPAHPWRHVSMIAAERFSLWRGAAPKVVLAVLLGCVQLGCDESSTPAESSAGESAAQSDPSSLVGKTIKFDEASEQYRGAGWSITETDYAWTDGPSATLQLPTSADPGPLTFAIRAYGLTQPPALLAQRVEVLANGTKVGEWEVGPTPAEYSVRIPAELTNGREVLMIELRLPQARSPASLGVNPDGRTLGICCYSIRLARLPVQERSFGSTMRRPRHYDGDARPRARITSQAAARAARAADRGRLAGIPWRPV